MPITSSVRKFEFVTFDGQPSKSSNDANRRRLVRTQAKRYSLESHTLATAPQSKTRPRNFSAYMGRFHLNIVPRQANEEAERGNIFRKDKNHKLVRPSTSDDDWTDKAAVILRRPPQYEGTLSQSLRVGRLDPFDTLSIKVGAQEELLFQHVNAAFELPSYIFNAGASLFKLVSTDPAWFHATLSLIALHHDLSTGHETSGLSLYHRGEALRLVQWRLQDGPEFLNDATIGAVASLVNFDAVVGDYASSTAHARGLTVMLSARGGIQSLGDNEVLQKVVGWSDLTYSATWSQKPRYPVIYSQFCDGSIENILTLEYLLPSGIFRPIEGLDDDLKDVLKAVRILTVLAESPQHMKNRERDLMRGTYIVEHVLLGFLEETGGSSMRRVVGLTFGLYLYLGLREIPKTAGILGIMMKRLRLSLDMSLGELDLVEPSLLFWIAYLGSVATTGQDDKSFFEETVDIMNTKLDLHSAEDRKRVLRSVVWTERISS